MKKAPYILAAVVLAWGCSSAPVKAKAKPKPYVPSIKTNDNHTPPKAAPVAALAPDYQYSRRITLTGSVLSAPPLKVMALAVVPFGTDANAIGMDKQKGGVQFQVGLESCSEDGCIVESGDVARIIVARSGIADAFPLGFIERGWKRQGLSSISDKGWLAVPLSTEDSTREIWVIDSRFRLRKRISHKIVSPCLLQWRGEDLFMVFQGNDGKMMAKQVLLDSGRIVSASPIEPWYPACPGQSATAYSAGWEGQNPMGFEGRLVMPLWQKGEAQPVAVELNDTVRPMTGNGLSSPVRLATDCDGRICIVTALGEDIWCMRFTPEGKLEAATHVLGSIAGDAKGIQIDRRGRFFYLETIMNTEAPEKIHLIRLE
jgi:hypothetical protein